MDELYSFCSELYSEEGEVENDIPSNPLFQAGLHMPKLSWFMKELCEGELTFNDRFNVFSDLQNNRTAGYNGFTVKLYHDIGNFWQSC